MQNQFTENYNKLYQCLSKPITEMALLNASTLSNWSKNTGIYEELSQAKKPEDFLWTQMKLANLHHLEAITYVKKASDIWATAISQMNELCTGMMHETTAKASEAIKTANRNTSKE